MCNSLADGGDRCDFHNPATTAIMENLSITIKADENTLKSTWKDLRNKGKDYPAPTRKEYEKFVEDQKLTVLSNPYLSKDEKQKFVNRVERSLQGTMISGKGYYALTHFSETLKAKKETQLFPATSTTDTSLTSSINYEQWPIPQADNLDKIATVVDAINGGATTADSIGESIDTVDRQGSYYANAAGYLGLVEKSKDEVGVTEFSLTSAGNEFLSLDSQERTVMLAQMINQTPIMQSYRASNGDKTELEKTIVESGYEESVAKRRANTITGWNNTLVNSDALTAQMSVGRKETIRRALVASRKQQEAKEAKKQEIFASIAKKDGNMCTGCFTARSLSGVCANCD
jgi:hypothetical protein